MSGCNLAAKPRAGLRGGPLAAHLALRRLGGWRLGLEPLAALMAALLAAALVFHGEAALPPAPMDQAFAEVDLRISRVDGHWAFHYPILAYSGGVSGSLIVGLYKLVVPFDPAHLNHHVRLLAALSFLATTWGLARALRFAPVERMTALALAASSGLVYLEPSTEAFAGALANLFVALWIGGRRGFAGGLALAVFALVKIELLAVAVVMAAAALLGPEAPPVRKVRFCVGFLLGLAALIAPDLYLYGARASLLGRESEAFATHFCWLFHARFAADCLAQDVPGARSLLDVLRQAPQVYLAFLARSSAESLWQLATSLNVAAAGLIFAVRRLSEPTASAPLRGLAAQALASVAATFVVASLFAVLHPRYLTRSYGLILILIVAAARARGAATPRPMAALPALTLAAHLAVLPRYLADPHGF